jgi:hypothetical protein
LKLSKGDLPEDWQGKTDKEEHQTYQTTMGYKVVFFQPIRKADDGQRE